MTDLVDVESHLATVLAAVSRVEAIDLPLDLALGRTLAAPVIATVDVPGFDNSAMDGFAVRYADVAAASTDRPASLLVVADLPAGTDADPHLDPGTAARIMTGAPLPGAADTVVPFEHTVGGLTDSLGTALITQAPGAEGAHVRRRGEDRRAGDVLVEVGTELTAFALGGAAASGVTQVTVTRPPRVAVVSTGDELVSAGGVLRRGQIPESNSVLLGGLCATTGSEVVLRTSVRDDGDELLAALTAARDRGADVIVTSGGVSAGAYEVVKTTLADMTFTSVAMQPGKPQGFAAGPPLLFGLPGNPVSAAVSFEVFVRPALLAMQGRTQLERPVLRLPAARGWRTPPGRRQYLPVRLVDGAVEPVTGGGSHQSASLALATGYAVVPATTDEVTAGDLVDVMLVG